MCRSVFYLKLLYLESYYKGKNNFPNKTIIFLSCVYVLWCIFLGCVGMRVPMCVSMHVSVYIGDIMNKNDFLNNRTPS